MKRQITQQICSYLLGLTLAGVTHVTLASELTKPHDHTASYQKPGAPVTMASKTQYQLALGQERTIELALKLAPGETQIRLQPDEGIVVQGPSHWRTDELHSSQTFKVTALAAQKAYIHVFVEHTSPQGHISTRALAIAIDSRGAQQALKSTAPAKPYVEMRAAETIY